MQVSDIPDKNEERQNFLKSCRPFVIPEGLEPPTSWAVTRCSIQLSYGTVPNCGLISQMRCKDRNIAQYQKHFLKKITAI